MEDVVIATLDKGKTEIRIMVRLHEGRKFVDVRTFVKVAAGDPVPTRKGVTVPPELLPQVIAALEEAAAQLSNERAAEEGAT